MHNTALSEVIVHTDDIPVNVKPTSTWPVFNWIGQQAGNLMTLGIIVMVAFLVWGIVMWVGGSSGDNHRRVVTGALEIERAQKRIGASLEAAPVVHVEDAGLRELAASIDFAEVCITSGLELTDAPAPDGAFRLEDVPGVAVVPVRAEGRKCARSWKISPLVGSDPDYPDVTPRDAAALREWDAAHAAA